METAIWIIIAVVTAAIGYFVASMVSKKNAQSRANTIIEEASREGDMIKEKKILKAKEEEMRIISDAEKVAAQKAQKIQTAEARMKQREIQLNQMQGENNRRKKELDDLKINLDNRQPTIPIHQHIVRPLGLVRPSVMLDPPRRNLLLQRQLERQAIPSRLLQRRRDLVMLRLLLVHAAVLSAA